jgi:hypothetical protein
MAENSLAIIDCDGFVGSDRVDLLIKEIATVRNKMYSLDGVDCSVESLA